MSASAFIDQSRAMARDIVNADVRGPGDLENAMRRVESRFGIPFFRFVGASLPASERHRRFDLRPSTSRARGRPRGPDAEISG